MSGPDRADPGALRSALLKGRNPDGGWGYYRGKSSRLEPTCWALLSSGAGARDCDVLRRWPAAGGLLLERQGGEPNFGFHGIALLAMRSLGVEHEAGTTTLLAGIERVKGIALSGQAVNRQDNSLQGWSWIADTFSWVEPTAWCLLALKRWSTSPGVVIDRGRRDVAERLLADRCCANGGWNYGNSNMLGQQLKPFVPTTAIALLAMQDRPADPVVVRSLAYLERAAVSEASGVALSLACMCLAAYGRPVDDVRAALEQGIPTTLDLGDQLAAALTLYALRTEGGYGAVTL